MSAQQAQAHQAVDRALALLPHEDPETERADDARRWIQVYRELVDLKQDWLSRLGDRLRDLSEEARLEIAETDEILIRNQRDHYAARLEYWEQRHWALLKLDLDPQARVIRHRGSEVSLTRREVALLVYLMNRPGTFVTAEQILSQAWHDGALHSEEVRTYVGRLRRKLSQVGAPARIVNSPRRGYTFVEND